MSLPTLSHTPIEIIRNNTSAEEESIYNKFIAEITKLYQYNIFKPMLDLVSTLCLKNRLRFNLYDRRFFEFDEGNCKTIEGGTFNKLLNKLKQERSYIITIKKVSNEIIVHEIAHMMEKEAEFSSLHPFVECIMKDIKQQNTNNISLKSAVNQIMITEVDNYHANHKASELFARFFQLVAMTKEVAGFAAQYGYTLHDIYQFFPSTIEFFAGDFHKNIIAKIDIKMAMQSQKYIKPLGDIEHKWSEEKAKSIHSKPNRPQWSKSIKSIKDNPFN
jgi:hypothetical protein